MKRLSILFLAFIPTLKMSADVYINKIINNSKQRFALHYTVPAEITPISAVNSLAKDPRLRSVVYKGIACYNAGIMLIPNGLHGNIGTSIHLNNGVVFNLEDSYIPHVSPGEDDIYFRNVLQLKTGSLAGLGNDHIVFSIRICDGYLEKIYPGTKTPIRISNEKIVDGACFSLEVRQKTGQIYKLEPLIGKQLLNPDAFEIIFTKN